MIEMLALGVVLLLIASAYWVRVGYRAICDLCAALERDRRVEYRHAVPPPRPTRRQCPAWLRRARA